MKYRLPIFALVACAACQLEPEQPPADWVLRNGAVYTVDAERSSAEAVAINGDRITYVGDDGGVEIFIGPETQVIDLDGKMLLPGFFDAHSHPTHAPVDSLSVRLYGLTSLEGYLDALREYASAYPDRPVIQGAGWSNTLFPPNGPRRQDLDRVVFDRPVIFSSEDGHSIWVNSKTLELAGVTKDTPDPEGGIIGRDPDTGEPSGTLRESAAGLVAGVAAPATVEARLLALEAFQEMAARDGVTTVRDAYVTLDDVASEAYRRADLTVRFRANLLFGPEDSLDSVSGYVEERAKYQLPNFTIDGIKLFIDGVVEGETAYLLEPYAHRPDYRGELLWDTDFLNETVAAFDEASFIVHAHAIGDGGVRVVRDAFAHARDVNGERDARHQVTHIQLVAPEDIRRFGELDIVAVPQPFWFTKGAYYENLEKPFLGEARADKEYPMQSFFDAGAVVASASDFPVTIPFSPLTGIEHGVLRTDDPGDPALTLGAEESASLEDMIASFTIHGAFASFLEDETGSIETGKLADLVVLESNLFDVPTENISETRVLMTFFEGEPVFRAEGF